MLCSLPRVRLWELELAMVGTPVSQLVDLMSTKVHEVVESPPSSSTPFPSVEDQWALSPLAPSKRKPTMSLLLLLLKHQGRRRHPHSRCSFPQAPQGHCWSHGNLSASGGSAGESCLLPCSFTHTSCQILQASKLKGLQQALPV